jgi:hypothetical protein
MDERLLRAKRENALAAVEAFSRFLYATGDAVYGKAFDEVAAALARGDDTAAIDRDALNRMGGMGSLGDRGWDTPDEERRFRFLSGCSHDAVANIRLYRDYAIDRPLVDISDGAFETYLATPSKPAARRPWWKFW